MQARRLGVFPTAMQLARILVLSLASRLRRLLSPRATLPQRPSAARSPPGGPPPPTPGAQGSAGAGHAVPRNHSCFRARDSPQKPELRFLREPELQPASSPGSKRALTRLWFRIGGGMGKEAGARDSRRTIGLDVYRSY